ncbi:PH domain-containing protein [Georgenia satyanarayanai]|uniref:PH domain-containing protein n=1 Tax=Georgenia satyanarayanai TaxID=860221 RepID=A0A2Y8ZZK5_9MICO|nr:PH domain-containing protein [Georgenia satyanarayanai]PYG02201.1 PH (Pleckstrin Homology) domain-containing protein [Georgenia satyanarayanai]SSA37036.1 PH domain-containing protein [Georgenia satyanarayanai]
MGPDDDRPREDERLPSEESWRVGRPWAAVLFLVVAALYIAVTVPGLLGGDGVADRGWRRWIPLPAAAAFLFVAAEEFRRRVAVDAEGVHLVALFRRKTYPWHEVAEVREGRPTLFGDRFVYLLRYGAKHVELPNSGGRLRLLQRWHAATADR